jgi:hypothetical protein
MIDKHFLNYLRDVVREPKDYSISFTFTLSSKDWCFEKKVGTEFNPRDTKELLLADLTEALYEIATGDEAEVLQYCQFKEE